MTTDVPDIDQRKIVELITTLHFGVIEKLTIRGGRPSYEPEPRVFQTIKLDSKSQAALNSRGSFLKHEFLELFDELGKLRTGIVDIEVRHGLPFRLVIERRLADLSSDLSSSTEVIA